MRANRTGALRETDDPRRRAPHPDERARGNDRAARRGVDRAARRGADHRPARRPGSPREQARQRPAPETGAFPRPPVAAPADGRGRPKSASAAKARAKARKAKAPKVVRPPLRERLAARLATVDLNPRRLVARVPFVVLVIGALAMGLGVTLWLSTDAADRSYRLEAARRTNIELAQQKEALEREVLEAQAAPALAEAARELGMIPSRDTAHLVQDPAGNWVVVGTPKPAEGAPPPPLNTPIPETTPAPPPPVPPAPGAAGVPPAAPGAAPLEVPVRVTPQRPGTAQTRTVPDLPGATPPAANLEVPHGVSGPVTMPGPAPVLTPVQPPAEQLLPVDPALLEALAEPAPHAADPGLPSPPGPAEPGTAPGPEPVAGR